MIRTQIADSEILEEYLSCLQTANKFSVCMGLTTLNGLSKISKRIVDVLSKGASGRFLIGIDMPTHPDALQQILEWKNIFPSTLGLRVFQSSSACIFHPKFSVFEFRSHSIAVLGSANLTQGGLIDNYEACISTDDPRTVDRLLLYFDDCYLGSCARKINTSWLEQYRSAFYLSQAAIDQLVTAQKKVRSLQPKPAPKKIRGYTFCFTGRVKGWIRDKLYPAVERLGGRIARKSGTVGQADYLVHGQFNKDTRNTLKLLDARRRSIQVISADVFLKLLRREMRRR